MQHRILTAEQLGVLLQSARKAVHITQAQLAAQLGLSQSRMSKIEHAPGSATVQQLLALGSALGIELVMHESIGPVPGDRGVAADAACIAKC